MIVSSEMLINNISYRKTNVDHKMFFFYFLEPKIMIVLFEKYF